MELETVHDSFWSVLSLTAIFLALGFMKEVGMGKIDPHQLFSLPCYSYVGVLYSTPVIYLQNYVLLQRLLIERTFLFLKHSLHYSSVVSW